MTYDTILYEVSFKEVVVTHTFLFVEKQILYRLKINQPPNKYGFTDTATISQGGLGTLDELFETLTLAQTGHVPRFPIILVGKDYWSGLMSWLKETVHESKKMSTDDFNLFRVVDNSLEAVEKIMEFHSKYRKDNQTNF